MEVIVVVDGPDPETVDQLRRMQEADARLHVVPLMASVGGSEARNIGVSQARGQWIALLDDDDEWLPSKLERQLALASTLIVSEYLQRTPGTEDIVWPRRLPRQGELMVEYMFDYLCYFQTSTFFCSRDLFLRIPFRKGQKGFQDIEWFLRVNSDPATQVAVVAEPLSIYNAPDGRTSITSGLRWQDRLSWGLQHRSLMTRKAYSRFLVGSCAGSAVAHGGGGRAFLRLGYECLVRGSASPRQLAILCLTFLMTPRFRRYVRDSFILRTAKALE